VTRVFVVVLQVRAGSAQSLLPRSGIYIVEKTAVEIGGFPRTPENRSCLMGEAMSNYLSDEQITLLLKPIHPARVLNLRGLSYVEGYDIRAELNRVFGFGRWSEEILEQTLVSESETKTSAGKPAWNIIYRTRVRLTEAISLSMTAPMSGRTPSRPGERRTGSR
jgi:hypothetical protein